MQRVRGLLVYETGATNVMTRADSALALGRGVCQDFAHVMLAACRRAGIPSRYVSGYLYDPQKENEVVETHAWVDVLDSERGWVSLDPTHDREQNEEYVRVAVGRDYGDVPPTRGVWKGTTEETLDVAVRIAVHVSRAARQRARRLARRGVRPLSRAACRCGSSGRRATGLWRAS